MANEIPKTDLAEIEILIERLKQNNLEQRDVELIERLLRTVLVLVNLLQRKKYVNEAAARYDLRSAQGKAEDGQSQPAGR
jgi:hypothetical protein